MRRARGRRLGNPALVAGVVGSLVVIGFLIWGVLGPPTSPTAFHPAIRFQSPSAAHLLGTDEFGRDVLSRVIGGAPLSVGVGLGAMLLAALVGIPLGILGGFFGGVADLATVSLADLLLAFPAVLLALLILTVLGGGSSVNVAIAVGISTIPLFVRLTRATVLSTMAQPFVEAAVVLGCTNRRVIARHVVPNLGGPVIALATLVAGTAILVGSSLSFVGLGPPPPSPEWGAMLSDARDYLQLGWWMSLFPGAAIALTVVTFGLLGDGLGGTLDPIYR